MPAVPCCAQKSAHHRAFLRVLMLASCVVAVVAPAPPRRGPQAFCKGQQITSVNYVRTDVGPGIRQPTDIAKAKGFVSGGLGPDSGKDLLIRLGLDILGVPDKHITPYRNSAQARLALQQGEINFYSESP